ncbi:MAG: cytochrome oxidase putative small subunit CydP [Rhodanobacter sp.]
MSGSTDSLSSPEQTHASPRPLRRLTLELFGVIALKIVLLTLIWWVVFAPQPKPDVSPAAIAGRLAPATPHAPPEIRP